jgi:hypothetical protein
MHDREATPRSVSRCGVRNVPAAVFNFFDARNIASPVTCSAAQQL